MEHVDFDVKIKVRFNLPSEGGRLNGLKEGIYSCPMVIDSGFYDCRIKINGEILLGSTYLLLAKFLDRNLAMRHVRIGKQISLWEGKPIARGEIVECSAH